MNDLVLYIVGNGFDLHHQIKSSYSDFGEYVKTVDPELYETVEEYFSFGGKWSNLEGPRAIRCRLVARRQFTFFDSLL
jgi:hypothetical protein